MIRDNIFFSSKKFQLKSKIVLRFFIIDKTENISGRHQDQMSEVGNFFEKNKTE